MSPDTRLDGLRVLVPRGGSWGTIVSAALRERGATPVVAPLIDFASAEDPEGLREALRRLQAGDFEWVTATSATVLDVLTHHEAKIPDTTKIAVVGESTAAAFEGAGYVISAMPPSDDATAHGLVRTWPEANSGTPMKVLTLRSNIAKPVLTAGLIERGHDVTQMVAFRVVGVPASGRVREDVASGRINAILISSRTIAEQVASQFPELPATTVLVCIGEETRSVAEELGLNARVTVENESLDAVMNSIVETVDEFAEYD